jgi:uncharacterized RDD family membrane protein YckC
MGVPDSSERVSYFFDRVLGKIIDLLVAAAFLRLGGLMGGDFLGAGSGIAYLLVADGLPGGSLGKRMTRLNVRRVSGGSCRYFESTIRNIPVAFAFLLSLIPWVGWFFMLCVLGIEFVMLVGTRTDHRLGDDWAGTNVEGKGYPPVGRDVPDYNAPEEQVPGKHRPL